MNKLSTFIMGSLVSGTSKAKKAAGAQRSQRRA